jgi:chromosome condensin MukBEF ATPase and DNA-binding subunit MukB
MILDMVNQNVQETLKKFQDSKNRETKNTINKEINELRAKIDNIKVEATQGMENLRKKNKTELQNKMEGKSSRLEQAEDRISELEDEMVIKGKTEELLVKQYKTSEKKMQELTNSIKRPNLRIMGTKPPLQKILQGILHTKSETQHNHERAGSTKLQEKKK